MNKNKYFKICFFIFLLIVLFSLNIVLNYKREEFEYLSSQVEIIPQKNISLNVNTGNNVTSLLKVSNVQTYGDTKEYTYKIKFSKYPNTSYDYSINDTKNTLYFDKEGNCEFKLNSNDELIIYDIPIDTIYEITQLDSENVMVGNTKTNVINSAINSNNEILFYNTEQVVYNPDTSDYLMISVCFLILTYFLMNFLKFFKVQKYQLDLDI